ncbi:MAG: lipid II:glycine glycyltransferase FemX [Spirochaetota bacterium]
MYVESSRKPTEQLIPTQVPQQTSFWAAFKQVQGLEASAFDIHSSGETDRHTDDMLVVFQHAGDGFHIGYVPYGPTLQPAEGLKGAFLEELSESLRPLLPESCIALRYDLQWESPWAKEDDFFTVDGQWLGPPAKKNQELRLNFSTHHWNLQKSQTDILPADTMFINLQPSEQQILMNMKPKTRYNVRLAARRGVTVRSCGSSCLSQWYELYRQTCQRNHIYLHDMSFFASLFQAAEKTPFAQEGVELLIAESEGDMRAAMFLLYSHGRATYLYGASANSRRNSMASYALQWEAIRRAKRRGCRTYDLFGTAPAPDPSHPMYGLYRFKSGFGGRAFHRMGCWDYPLDERSYALYQTTEMLSRGYHL